MLSFLESRDSFFTAERRYGFSHRRNKAVKRAEETQAAWGGMHFEYSFSICPGGA